jgi:hypothetical protein
MDENTDSLLHLRDSDLAKRKAEFELRKLKREASRLGWLLSVGPGMASLLISFVSLLVAFNTASMQNRKTEAELEAAQAKQFADLIQAAADPKRTPGERIASLLLLGRYWADPKRTDVLANALCGIIMSENDDSVMSACVGAIGLAYKNTTPGSSDRQRLKELLYGKSDGSRQGIVLRAQALVMGVPTLEEEGWLGDNKLQQIGANFDTPVSKHLYFLSKAVQQGREDLKDVYLQRAHLEGIELQKAKLRGANLRAAHLQQANFNSADLEKTDLEDAHLEGANLGDAHLYRADLRHAKLQDADLKGADVEGAVVHDRKDLEGAKGNYKGTVIVYDKDGPLPDDLWKGR